MSAEQSVVLIGGFLGNKLSLEHVALNLSYRLEHPDFDIFTFAEAMNNPERTARAIDKNYVMTHSAGMLAVKNACGIKGQAQRLTSFAPPMPRSKGYLLRQSLQKTRQMHAIPGMTYGAVRSYERDSVAEAIRHPYGNFRHFPEIAKFNGLAFAKQMAELGTAVDLVRHTDDVFYAPTNQEIDITRRLPVSAIYIEGVHDELLLRPSRTLQRCLEATSAMLDSHPFAEQ